MLYLMPALYCLKAAGWLEDSQMTPSLRMSHKGMRAANRNQCGAPAHLDRLAPCHLSLDPLLFGGPSQVQLPWPVRGGLRWPLPRHPNRARGTGLRSLNQNQRSLADLKQSCMLHAGLHLQH